MSVPKPSRSSCLAAVTILAVTLYFFRDCVFFGRMLYQRDIDVLWNGMIQVLVECAARGSLPLWNPYPAFGQPLLAVAVFQVFYPTTWLHLLLPTPVAYTVLVVFHTWLGGLGVFALCRRLSVSAAPAVASGCLWACCGPVQSLTNMANMCVAAAWLPWIFVAADRALETGRARHMVVWGGVWAMTVLAGSPEIALMGGASVLMGLHRVHWRRLWVPGNRGPISAAVLTVALAIGFSAAQWIPTLEAHGRSTRAIGPKSSPVVWSVHPASLPLVLLPLQPWELPLNPEALAYFEGREPLLYAFYLGLVSVGPVGAAIWMAQGLRRWLVVGLALLAVALSMGHSSFFYAVRQIVPLIDQFRYPSKLLVLVALCWVVLVGIGLEQWRRGIRRRWAWCVAIAVPVFVLSLMTGVFCGSDGALWRWTLTPARQFDFHSSPSFLAAVRALATTALLGAAMTVTAVLRGLRGASPALGIAACALVVADVAWNPARLNPTVPRALNSYRSPALERIPRPRPNRTLVLDYARIPRNDRFPQARPYQSLPLDVSSEYDFTLRRLYPRGIAGSGLWRIEGAAADVTKLWQAENAFMLGHLYSSFDTPVFGRLLRATGFEYVLAVHEERRAQDLDLVARYPTSVGEPLRLFRVRNALPRAFVVGGAEMHATPGSIMVRLCADDFDPRRTVLLTGTANHASPPGFRGEARILELAPDRVRLETHASHPGWVVLLESADPGWRATVDGTMASVVRANLVFRAVPVGPGRHVVEMRYRPTSVWIGLLVTFTSLLVAAVLMVRK